MVKLAAQKERPLHFDSRCASSSSVCRRISRCKAGESGSLCTRNQGNNCPPCLYKMELSREEYSCYLFVDSRCPLPDPSFVCMDEWQSFQNQQKGSKGESSTNVSAAGIREPSMANSSTSHSAAPDVREVPTLNFTTNNASMISTVMPILPHVATLSLKNSSSRSPSPTRTEKTSNGLTAEMPSLSSSNDYKTITVSSVSTSFENKSTPSRFIVIIFCVTALVVSAALVVIFCRLYKRRRARYDAKEVISTDILLDIGQAHTMSKHPYAPAHFMRMREVPETSLSLAATEINLEETSTADYIDCIIEGLAAKSSKSEMDSMSEGSEGISSLHKSRDSEIPADIAPSAFSSFHVVDPSFLGADAGQMIVMEGRFSDYSISSSLSSFSSFVSNKTNVSDLVFQKEIEL